MPTATTKILLVEDNPGDVRLVREALTEIAKPRVELVHCETMAEAVAACSNGMPDAILLDLGLPDSQGLDSVRRMRDAAPDAPIAVLTVRDEEDLAIQALREGAQDYLPKSQIGGALIWRALRYAMERQQIQLQLLNLSLIDELTGLHNRRGFLALGEHYVRLANRSGTLFMVAFVDVDDMKLINDTFGHQEGNRGLVEAANVLKDSCRRSDILGRIGGDEFAILIADADTTCGNVVLQRIQQKLDSRNGSPGRRYPLSLSVGLISANVTQYADLERLLDEADAAMYDEKQRKKATQGAAHKST
jgi:diguanylate cyclase (GGDEF)-like protein